MLKSKTYTSTPTLKIWGMGDGEEMIQSSGGLRDFIPKVKVVRSIACFYVNSLQGTQHTAPPRSTNLSHTK